ncbi:ABC transporter permease [Sporosarcina ureilytica]|uniref:ABC transporter permease n=1 Tax=Sporosarcina ureilytica TaxID=298596 RepID=A0A1D8JCK1_9BACL|nr:ABC transporter permease [Sporosarcina ureilytica]
MLKLIQNEWMKLWQKKSTWVMVLLLFLIVPGMMGLMKWLHGLDDRVDSQTQNGVIEIQVESEEASYDWKVVVENELAYIQERLNAKDLSKVELQELEGKEKILEYRLANSIEPLETPSRESMMTDTSGFTSIVLLFTVVVAAGIVAAEFSQGTIKMLLSRPVRRWKILTSKFVTVNMFSALLILIGYLLSVSFSYLLFQTGDGQLLSWNGQEVVETSILGKSVYMLALSFGSVFVTSTFAFMIGVVFRSSSMAIGLSIFLYFTGTSIVLMLERFSITKYLVFTHMDLTQYGTGYKIIEDISMPFSLMVLSVYIVVFLVTSYWTFIQRDVKA